MTRRFRYYRWFQMFHYFHLYRKYLKTLYFPPYQMNPNYLKFHLSQRCRPTQKYREVP